MSCASGCYVSYVDRLFCSLYSFIIGSVFFSVSMSCLANVVVVVFLGAFKTLDKDNNGTVKFDVQEVLYVKYN